MILDDFQPSFSQPRTSVDCLPLCIRAVLEYQGEGQVLDRLLPVLTADEGGYDFLEVMAAIAGQGWLLGAGHRDVELSVITTLDVKPAFLADLETWIVQRYPVILTVGIAEFMEIDSEAIHAIVVYGFTDSAVSFWDPVLGHYEVPKEHLDAAWQAVGSYYAVLGRKEA